MKYTDGTLTIVNVIHEIDDFVQLEDESQHIVDYSEEIPFFELNGEKYYLNTFMKV